MSQHHPLVLSQSKRANQSDSPREDDDVQSSCSDSDIDSDNSSENVSVYPKKRKWEGIRCKFCPRGVKSSYLPSRQALLAHKLKVHPTERMRALSECDICHALLANKKGLQNHKICVHSDITHSCEKCGKAFKTVYTLRRHERSHTQTGKTYECKLCSKKFPRDDQLASHLITHSTTRSIHCNLCRETFKRPSALNTHVQRVHTGEKHFVCRKCGQDFDTKLKLDTHKKLMHIGVENVKRDFKCPFCKKGFESKAYLHAHSKIHNEVKRFACDQCEFRSHTSTNMKLHKDGVHTQREKSWKCTICGNGFKSKYQLRTHTINHTKPKDRTCYFCEKKFNARQAHELHLISHVKERSFTCVEKGCNLTFGYASCLKKHAEMHSGVKPFSCGDCGGSWFQKGNYERHNCKNLQLKKIPCRQAGCDALFKNVKTSITHYKNFHA